MRVERWTSTASARFHIASLLPEHYIEVANIDVYTLAPDWDKYDAIDDAGNLLMWLAFNDDHRCIGYSINFLMPHIHYAHQTVLSNDVLFVSKEYRTGSIGGRLMAATRKGAKEAGAVLVQWHAKPNTPLDHVLSKRLPIFEIAYQDIL